VEQVGTEQRALGFFEQQARFPTVRDVRRQKHAKAILPRAEHFSICHCLRRTAPHIVDAHDFADETTHGDRLRRERLPFRERAAFIGLEMTEADPPERGGSINVATASRTAEIAFMPV
jgi:hypothetical protein